MNTSYVRVWTPLPDADAGGTRYAMRLPSYRRYRAATGMWSQCGIISRYVVSSVHCPHKALTLGWLQTEMNIYICFDLCTGGELFTRICNKGCYPEMFVLALLSSSWALTIALDKRSRLSTPS